MNKECLICGAEFLPKNHSQIYCGTLCNTKARNMRQEKTLKGSVNFDIWDKILKRWGKYPDIDLVRKRAKENNGNIYEED